VHDRVPKAPGGTAKVAAGSSQAAAETARLQGRLEGMETLVHMPAEKAIKKTTRTKGNGAAKKHQDG